MIMEETTMIVKITTNDNSTLCHTILEQLSLYIPQCMNAVDCPWHVFHVIDVSCLRVEYLEWEITLSSYTYLDEYYLISRRVTDTFSSFTCHSFMSSLDEEPSKSWRKQLSRRGVLRGLHPLILASSERLKHLMEAPSIPHTSMPIFSDVYPW